MADTAWKITGQRQTTVSNGQTYVPAMIVSFKTGQGNYGNVTLSATDYTADGVTSAVQAAANAVDEVGKLSAGTMPTLNPLSGS